jgi:hypothetical protein
MPEAVVEHLAECVACLDAYLDAALRRPALAHVPSEFEERLLSRLSSKRPVEKSPHFFPYFTIAASILAVFLGIELAHYGVFDAALGRLGTVARMLSSFHLNFLSVHSRVLIPFVAAEIIVSAIWFWRQSLA